MKSAVKTAQSKALRAIVFEYSGLPPRPLSVPQASRLPKLNRVIRVIRGEIFPLRSVAVNKNRRYSR